MSTEQHTRTLLGPADPVRSMAAARSGPPADNLITLAEATQDPAPGHPGTHLTRRLVLAAGTAVVAAGAIGVTAAATRARRRPAEGNESGAANPAQGTVLVPIAYQYTVDAPPAAPRLRALAASVGDAPYDNQTGQYTYHRVKFWGGSMASPDRRYLVALAGDLRSWRASDGSGRQVTTQLEPEYPDQASKDYWAPRLRAGGDGTGSTDTLSYAPGDIPPLPADRTGLDSMLAVNDAGAVPKFVAMVYTRYAVPRQTRAEILRILADIPGYLWRGTVTDRAGRAGVAITFNDTQHGYQDLLIFDPRTGVLLALEMLETVTQGTGRAMRLDSYQLVLDTDLTDRLG